MNTSPQNAKSTASAKALIITGDNYRTVDVPASFIEWLDWMDRFFGDSWLHGFMPKAGVAKDHGVYYKKSESAADTSHMDPIRSLIWDRSQHVAARAVVMGPMGANDAYLDICQDVAALAHHNHKEG